MALVLKDRVKETTTTTGTGTVTLAGAVTGFQSFSVIGNANTTYYAIVGQNTNEWEVGIGTYTASGTTLSRDTVLESSNSGSLVNFSAGAKDVFVTYPAERSIYTDAAGTVITPATASALAVVSGGTGATSAPDARTNLGATTVGGNLFTLTNPSAITFPRFNADNTVSALSNTDFRTAIGAGTGNGTVTSVAATAGTGISVTGSPITSSGTLTITNTAPDQTVVLTAGTGISTSGTYPSFTVTNTAPDQTVSLTGGTGISVTGTYPSFTVTNTSTATGDVVGPASATDNAIARYDGTTGKLIQNSAVTIGDTGNTVISVTDNSNAALRITQLGTGNALVVEDSANPDSTPTVITADGNVGIGTSSPTVKLQVNASADTVARFYGNTANNYIQVSDNNGTNNASFGAIAGGNAYIFSAGYNAFFAGSAERMRIDSSGNVGIGTSSPTQALDVNGNILSAASITIGTGGLYQAGSIYSDSSWGMIFRAKQASPSQADFRWANSADTERMRITSAGGVSFGSSGTAYGTSGQVLQSNGNATPTWTNTITSPVLATASTTGAFSFGGAIDETVFAVSGTTPALSPSNGTIQTWTLSANSTPTAGTWNAGESMTMMINDSASSFTVTWTSLPVTWVGGSAPPLTPSSGFTVIEFWKVGTTIYGALVGQI